MRVQLAREHADAIEGMLVCFVRSRATTEKWPWQLAMGGLSDESGDLAGRRDIRVEDVPDPSITDPSDAIVRITTTGICGSDLHLYEVLGAFLEPGDVLG